MNGVYVAGSSSDIDRAERAIAELELAGVAVTSTWPIIVRDVGSANPRDADRDERLGWSVACLAQIRVAEILWLLVPPAGVSSPGAWLEVGYALARGRVVIASGDSRQSIFGSLTYEFTTDEEALALILRVADRMATP